MKQEKMKYRILCLVFLAGVIAFVFWYIMIFNNKRDYTKDSTLIKQGRHIAYCISDTGKTIASCLQKGVKSL